MEGIQISINQADLYPDISVVKIQGYIDTTTASELERVLQNLLREQHYRIVIDLTQVEYVSSAGWGIFISEIKNIRSRRGDLKLAKMSASVSEVYELLEFSTILQSAESVDDAIALFEGGNPALGDGGPVPAAKASAAPAKPAAAAPVSRPQEPKPAPARSEPVTPAPAVPRIEPAAQPKPALMPSSPPAPKPASVPRPPAAPAARPPVVSPAVRGTELQAVPPAPALLPEEDFAEEAPDAHESQDAILVPLNQRIRAAVRAHPDWGALKIKRELNRRRGSQPKVSWGEVRAELKFSGLKTKADRFKFAQGR